MTAPNNNNNRDIFFYNNSNNMHPFSGYTIDLTFECRNLELTIPNHY